ncbi:MAG TPA: excinuclease ABC subunit UvrC [Sediminibacterium sp.]|uniref:excinuclease ABC subunit UvrC n=1 Tax=Sediminibacterium sp. TaxID=1917865 RepID=UPI0008D11DE3|nr:excinuclease ABC subunit UvrC [Sediminibacterium sp.]OHC86044.1 MAG: excinuclease ABC subunit C [Sphingobacteriia bacterium RIFOXYC2_FULL_35_18]OHC89559.1 MAG: excinuclease ABC subunit C [Sphingobacteriia bacterium RIFOXYD2_FULL_35_12]HLD54568.1 excinuclease ABC subunit UvrC [Sediminibacterium sp.]
MTQEAFQQIAHTIPLQPGIYKYYDKEHTLLYVGKAKSLRKRVSSYFSKSFVGYKTHELVKRIHQIEFTIVDSEQDAFLLENALIKEYKPKYNIELKDDKTYPYIVVKREAFPRIFLTRRKINDGSEYIGPFTSAGKVRELIEFVKQYIPLRSCKLNLSKENIAAGKFKVCLEYHLGNCKGPCEGLQSLEDYQNGIQQMRNILKGNLGSVIAQFKEEMQQYAMGLEFEKAELIRKKIDHLENYQSSSVVVSKHLTNIDVFSIAKDDNKAYVNYLMVQNGTIVQTHSVPIETKLEETEEEVLVWVIGELRNTFNSMAKELIVPFPIEYPDPSIIITIPKAGDKRKLLDLSLKNVAYFKEELRKKKILRLEGKTDDEQKKVLYELQQYLQLDEVPIHIECFDNSNFQGAFPVSAMVCFKNGIPSKNDYRRFNVKTVEGINDFATMKEVVYRRYKRLKEEALPFPQLVIIDGGKGQLSSAMEAFKELNIVGVTTVVGLAKNEEEIFFPGDSESFKLPMSSDSLKLVRRIRDEVHRFGITFHRNQRSKGTFKNELEQVPGIGKATIDELLRNFKSVKNIKLQSEQALAMVVGVNRATILTKYFKGKE